MLNSSFKQITTRNQARHFLFVRCFNQPRIRGCVQKQYILSPADVDKDKTLIKETIAMYYVYVQVM